MRLSPNTVGGLIDAYVNSFIKNLYQNHTLESFNKADLAKAAVAELEK